VLTSVLIDYDLVTKEIRRIIVPENDAEVQYHPAQSGWGRATMQVVSLPVDPVSGKAIGRSSLARAANAVQAVIGSWPPNVVK
jgi:hypothetical protein